MGIEHFDGSSNSVFAADFHNLAFLVQGSFKHDITPINDHHYNFKRLAIGMFIPGWGRDHWNITSVYMVKLCKTWEFWDTSTFGTFPET